MPVTNTTNIYTNSRYVVDNVTPGAVYTTIQSAIDAALADGANAEIWIRQGNYIENLTLYDTINIIGAEKVLSTISGTHTPPTSGTIAFTGLGLSSATHIISSAAAGTTQISFIRCEFNCTNGYICSTTNWSGSLYFESCTDLSTNNGIVNNSNGSVIDIANSIMGAGTNVFTANGNVKIFSSEISSPISLTSAGTSEFGGGSILHDQITTSNTHTLTIGMSEVNTGATQAITHNSSSTLVLNNVLINSTNAPAIGGSGTIQLMSVSFPNDYDSAATITDSVTGTVKAQQMLAENIVNMEDSGFESWDAAGPYFDDTVLGTFDLLVGGVGYIKNERITWAAQSVSGMTAGNTYWIYIDDTGTIGLTATRTDALFSDNIVLFECLRDSTVATNNQITVKENHPYNFQTGLSNYLHNTAGSVIENTQGGANITLNGTQGIQINGADELDDHGLETDIPDSGAAAVTWRKMHTLGSGKWATYNTTNTFLGVYNNAGTVTALGASKYAVYTLYVCKDNLNSSTPTYFAVIDNAQYNNLAAANTAISNSTIARATGELLSLELAQLGYIIFSEASNSIVSVIVEKQTLRSTSTTSGTNIASLVTTSTTNFDGWLSAADTNVQAALETIDELGKTNTVTGSILAGTFDTNVAAAAVTLTATTLSADGTDANIDINITPKGSGSVVISDIDVAAGEIDGTAIGANSASTGAFTTIEGTQVTIDPGASGDSFVQFDINTTGEFRIGVDDDDGDEFKISQGSALGTTDCQTITAAGEVNFPLTPAFLANHSVTQLNITGTGTQATVNYTNEIFDQNSDYDGTNTFTAPVTGRYQFNSSIYTSGYTGAATAYTQRFNTSNRQYRDNQVADISSVANLLTLGQSVLADMDAADTCTVNVSVFGEATDVIDSNGDASLGFFSGFLAC